MSISVADIFNRPCLASSKTFAKIGIVALLSTIFLTNESDFTKLDFDSCNFIYLENKFIIANF